jgi:hypothetical protein
MGIGKDFNKVLHDELAVHAAWLPVTNTFRVGDFGVIHDGLFVRQGNIGSDFGVAFSTATGPAVKLDFKSDRVREIGLDASGQVAPLPDQPVEAGLRIEFERAKSFYIKANLTADVMENVFSVARALAAVPSWNEDKFKVLSATYHGTGCVVLSSKAAGTVFEIKGKADALKNLGVAGAAAGFSFKSNSSLGLEIVGQNGVVGLAMFKVRKKSGDAEFLGDDDIDVSRSERWPADLEDDL